MSRKLLTRSVQFHSEIWQAFQTIAEVRDESTANVVRDFAEAYLKDYICSFIYTQRSHESEQSINNLKANLPKMSSIELAKLYNDCMESSKGDSE